MSEHFCKNCNNSFTASYCNVCGQKVAHRITLKHIWHDIVHAFTHADKGIFHLFFQLFTRPGIVSREYIVEEKRKKYFNPFQYLLIIGSIAAFVAANSHFMETFTAAMTDPTRTSARQAEVIKTISYLQGKYFNIILLLQLPFIAFASFLWYRKFHFNYAEHLTHQTFVGSQNAIFGMLMMLATAAAGKAGVYFAIMAVFSISFQVMAYKQFFKEPGFKGVMRGFASVITGLLFFVVFVLIIMIIIMAVLMAKTKK